jgi:hypothetical protein
LTSKPKYVILGSVLWRHTLFMFWYVICIGHEEEQNFE